jgi:hypothetical protein
MKQTAVEFLAKSLKDFPHIKHSFRFKEVVEQAKEMEKEQIVDAHYQGYRKAIGTTEISENYYNETYGGNK